MIIVLLRLIKLEICYLQYNHTNWNNKNSNEYRKIKEWEKARQIYQHYFRRKS